MNVRERLEIMVRTDRGSMTVWSQAEVRDALDAFRAEVLNKAADGLSVWPGDQTPEEERPGYDGPTIDAADRLDDCLRPMPWEDRAQLISEHRQMVVGEVAAKLRRMAAAGQAPAPEAERIPLPGIPECSADCPCRRVAEDGES